MRDVGAGVNSPYEIVLWIAGVETATDANHKSCTFAIQNLMKREG